MSDTDVLIVGGGISGLATAWWLARCGLAVEVWEREAHAGGKIRTTTSEGYTTERAAALVMSAQSEVERLVSDSGLDPARRWRRAGVARYVVRRGRLQAVPLRPRQMIRSPLWSLGAKLRLLAEPFIPRGGSDTETVSGFIERRLGTEMLRTALEPYVAGPLASDPDRANAATVLPHLSALERRYGSITAGVLVHKLLGRRTAYAAEGFSFSGGMSALTGALARAPGVRLRTNCSALAIEPRGSQGWRVEGQSPAGHVTVHAPHLVLSTPAGPAAALTAPLDHVLAQLLGGIQYAAVSIVHLGLDRAAVSHALDGTGFLVPRAEAAAPTGCLWMSSLFGERAPPGKVLLSCYLGGARLPQAIDWEDSRSAMAVVSALDRWLGLSGEPEMLRIDRHRQGLPLYHGAYAGRLRAIEERLSRHHPGLHLVANYRGGVSVRDRIACGHIAAEGIAAALGARRRDSGYHDTAFGPRLAAIH